MKSEILLAVIITVSLFSPFTYAQPEKSAMKASTFWEPKENKPAKETTDEDKCAGEVGIDKFNYSDYRALRRHVINNLPQIDAYGDYAKGAQEAAYDEQEQSEVPGTAFAKNNFVMGPNGKILLYDVQRHQVASPAEACHLTNLVYDGKMSYAIRTGETAFCGDEDTCNSGWESSKGAESLREQNNALVEFKDALMKNKTSVRRIIKGNPKIRQGIESVVGEIDPDSFDPSDYTETEKVQMLQAVGVEQSDKISKLMKSLQIPYNKVTSDYLYLSLAPVSQAEMYLIPETYSKFIKWMQLWRSFDDWYLIVASASLLASFKKSGASDIGQQGTKEIGEEGVKEGTKWTTRVKEGIKNSLRNKNFQQSLTDDTIKDISKIIQDAETGGRQASEAAEQIGWWGRRWQSIKGWGRRQLVGADAIEQAAKNVDDLPKEISKLKKEQKILREGLYAAEKTDNADAIVKYSTELLENQKKIEKLQELRAASYKVMEWGKGSEAYKLGLEGIEEGERIKKISSAIRLGARIAGLKGRALRLAMASLLISYVATSGYNEYLIDPYFRIDAVDYDISKEECNKLKKVRGEDTNCYVGTEIEANSVYTPRKPEQNTAMSVAFGFLTTRVDPNTYGLPNRLTQKARHLGKHVYIVDQVNFDTAGGGKPTNIIKPFGEAFYFYSVHPGSVGYLAWEDPDAQRVMPGYTSIWLYSHNVLTQGGIFEKDNNAFKQTLKMTAGATRAIGAMALNYAWIVGVPRTIFPTGALSFTGTAVTIWWFAQVGSGQFVSAGSDSWDALTEGVLIDPKIAYENKAKLCTEVAKKYAGAGWENRVESEKEFTPIVGDVAGAGEIGAAKTGALWLMIGARGFQAASEVFPPAVIGEIALDFASMYAEMKAIDVQKEAIEKLMDCYEPNAELAAIQKIPTAQDLQQAAESENPVNQGISQVKSLIQGMSPEAGKMISDWENYAGYQVQRMHLVGQAIPTEGNVGRASILADRIYDVYMHGGNVRWFIPKDCPISLCYEDPNGNFKCSQESGYYFLGPDGKPVLEGPAPQLLSLGVDMDKGYAYLVSKVIEVRKNDEDPLLLDINPRGEVHVYNDCFRSALESKDILALDNEHLSQEYKDMIIASAFGNLQVVNAKDTILWFKPGTNETIATFYAGIPDCEGATFGGTMHYPNSHIKFKRDSMGTIEVVSEGKTVCKTSLGAEGSIVFSSGMIRPGFKQDEKTDFSGVYHVYLSGVLSGLEQDLSSDLTMFDDAAGYFDTENCTMPDGTPGWKLVWKFKESADEDIMTQWKTKEETMCMPTFGGTDNEVADFHKDENGNNVFTFTYTGDDGNPVTQTYTVEKWVTSEESPYSDKPGYQLTGEDGKTYFATIEAGPDGVPRLVITDGNGNVIGHGSVPMMWMNGPNGGYTSSNGKIGMTNEFYFPLNPQFTTLGANGLGLMTPSKPPWGAPDVNPPKGPVTTQQNPLLSLPSVPEGNAGIVFVLMIIASLAIARELARKRKQG